MLFEVDEQLPLDAFGTLAALAGFRPPASAAIDCPPPSFSDALFVLRLLAAKGGYELLGIGERDLPEGREAALFHVLHGLLELLQVPCPSCRLEAPKSRVQVFFEMRCLRGSGARRHAALQPPRLPHAPAEHLAVVRADGEVHLLHELRCRRHRLLCGPTAGLAPPVLLPSLTVFMHDGRKRPRCCSEAVLLFSPLTLAVLLFHPLLLHSLLLLLLLLLLPPLSSVTLLLAASVFIAAALFSSSVLSPALLVRHTLPLHRRRALLLQRTIACKVHKGLVCPESRFMQACGAIITPPEVTNTGPGF